MRILKPLTAGCLLVAMLSIANLSRGFAAPVKESDPILIGTKWTGKLTQRGTFAGGGTGPPQLDLVFTVTKRDGNTFEADLKETTPNIKITYLVKGEIGRTANGNGYTLKFESYDSKDRDTVPVLGVPYTATLTGRSIKGTWKMKRGDEMIDIEGDFTLELGK